ncbi:MAG: right-handed parallel beta-helix repeat-containing protein, partial [Bacteroidota bacterium]|nr:right-handed parallel beta-helix repeat-containing protein [Bacteroidota bacterium]
MNQIFAVFIMFLIGCSPQSTYYVDSQTGDDTNKGTLKKPFKSIEKLDSLKLLPGNSVLFAGGQSFAGTLKL